MKRFLALSLLATGLFPAVGPADAAIIAPTVNQVSSDSPLGLDRGAARTRDGSGLTSGATGIAGGADATHGRVANGTMWMTKGNTATPTDKSPSVVYDLGETTDLQTIRIWNYNENTFTKFGAKRIRVSTSRDNAIFTVWGDIDLAKGGSTTAEPAQDFAVAVSAIRYVKFQILTSWDGASFWSAITGTDSGGADTRYLVGLSEVRFVGTPTPPPANAVSNPSPTTGATAIEPDAALSWDGNNTDGRALEYQVTVGVGAVGYDYVVETASIAPGAQDRVTWTPPANVIQKDSTFWWRVDKVTAQGTVAGPVWTFTARAETTAEKDARMAWFRHDKFFGAIVWGLYSGAEGVWPPKTGTKNSSWTYAEWMQFWKDLDTLTYRNTLEPYLTGDNFDAAAMARMCKAAGMTMVYVMPRHHDGYAIWDTQTSTLLAPNGFKIANSAYNPQKRDYLKELVDALHAEGLRVGFYFSLGDWHHPDFPHDGVKWAHPQKRVANPAGHTEVWADYVDYLHQQVREIVDPDLVKDYGQFDVVYFDYSSDGINGESWGATKLVHMVRRYHPNIIINNRLWNGLDNTNGDFATPEAVVPAQGYSRDWEAIMSANEPATWGYGRPDLYPFKSPATLVSNIVDVAAKGGVIELSVSPKADGSLHPDQVAAYANVGAWMAVNGESIKGTTASPSSTVPSWGFMTSKRDADRLYLHVFTRPSDGNVMVTNLIGTVNGARLMRDPTRTLTVTETSAGFSVFLPADAVDAYDSVIEVDYDFPESVAGVSSENVLSMDRDANRAVDGSGLSRSAGGFQHAEGETGIAWTTVGTLGPGTDYDPWITFDLGEVCDVTAIREWGYNTALLVSGTAMSKIGPKNVDVYTSVDGLTFTFAGAVQFAQAPGTTNYVGNTISVNYKSIRYIKLDIRTNYDGAVFDGTGSIKGADGRSLTGLSEIHFDKVFQVQVQNMGFNSSAFRINAEGFDMNKTYRMLRATDLRSGFTTVVDGPRLPGGASGAFEDPAPPAGGAFYRIEKAP